MFILYCESHTVQLLKNYFDKTNSEYQYQFPLGSLDLIKQKNHYYCVYLKQISLNGFKVINTELLLWHY